MSARRLHDLREKCTRRERAFFAIFVHSSKANSQFALLARFFRNFAM
jgi:hypothetical protein